MADISIITFYVGMTRKYPNAAGPNDGLWWSSETRNSVSAKGTAAEGQEGGGSGARRAGRRAGPPQTGGRAAEMGSLEKGGFNLSTETTSALELKVFIQSSILTEPMADEGTNLNQLHVNAGQP